MRKNKFRAWDKEFNRMVFQHDVNLALEHKEYLFSLSEEGVELLHYDEDYSAYVKCDAELMQYTGLKDKNSKEIYEGDIVRKIIDGENRGIGKIVYKNCGFKIHILDPYFEFYSELTDIYKVEDMGGTIELKQSFEIIGNIYEDSDLLK